MTTTTTYDAAGTTRFAPSILLAFRAEWTKLRTLRSTWVTIAGAAALSVLLAALVAATEVSKWDTSSAAQRAEFDATSSALVGVLFATVILGALGVRAITAEYSTGMIRATFGAIPRRRRVLVAKAAIIAALALPAALGANVVAFVVGQRILAAKGAQASIGDPGVLRAIVLGGVAVSVTAVLGVGLGAIMRRTAAATTALSVAIIGSQLFAVGVPEGGRRYLPGSALQAAVTVDRSDDLLDPAAGLLVLAVYAAVALVIALALVGRRDT